MNYKSIISRNIPSDIEKWNSICLSNANLYQSTLIDKFDVSQPIYIEIHKKETLIGGVKFYFFESKRLPKIINSISRSCYINSEYVLIENQNINKEKIENIIKEKLLDFTKKNKVNALRISHMYDSSKKIDFTNQNTNQIGIATIDLEKSEQCLLKDMHGKHRNMINRAKREKLIFKKTDNIDDLLLLFNETFKDNLEKKPNESYIRNLFKELNSLKISSLYSVYDQSNKLLSSAIIDIFGDNAYYSFSGNNKNNLGSGQFLQLEIINVLKKKHIKKYHLGQVSLKKDNNNLKFSKNITDFKIRFGANVTSAENSTIIYNSLNCWLWKQMIRLSSLKNGKK